MGNQKDYQSQIDQTLDDSKEDEVLTLSAADVAEAKEIKEPESEPIVEEKVESQIEADVKGEIDPTTGQSYTKEQVSSIVRNRVASYEKRLGKMTEYKSALNKIAEVSGLSEEQLITRLNNMSDAEQAKMLGISPEQVAGMRATRASQENSEKEIKKLNRELEMSQLKADKKYSDIDVFMDDILFKIEDHPSLSLKDAYLLVKGAAGVTTSEIRDAEQRVLNSQAAARGKGQVNPVGGAQAPPKKMSAEIVNAAKKVDMDVNEYVAFQEIDNIDAYRAYKKLKGK